MRGIRTLQTIYPNKDMIIPSKESRIPNKDMIIPSIIPNKVRRIPNKDMIFPNKDGLNLLSGRTRNVT